VLIAATSASKSIVSEDGEGSLMADFDIRDLAIPSVCLLISFLAYSSQVLFRYLDPHPLTGVELVEFNGLVLCIWTSYYRACRIDPGHVPPAWMPQASSDEKKQDRYHDAGTPRSRRCRKCEVMKPPRAHHCKICQRSVFRRPL
jgi:palmitoyltransferase